MNQAANRIKSNTDTNIISSKLKALISKNKITENDLALALNLPVMTIRRIVHGETLDPRISTLKLIADYFNVPLNALLEENMNEFSNNLGNNLSTMLVPILNWQILGQIDSFKEVDLMSWNNWQPIIVQSKNNLISPESFALESRPSMRPRFLEGTIFIVDPNCPPDDSDLVLIKFKENSSVALKELQIDPPRWLLKGVTESSGDIIYDGEKHKIIGTVILTMLYTKNTKQKNTP